VAPVSLYLGVFGFFFCFNFFLSKGSVFWLLCFAGTFLTKDQFLQLVGDPSGALHFVGWLAENRVFSDKGWICQKGGECVSPCRAEIVLCLMQTIYFLILHRVLACTYVFSAEA